MSASPKAVPRLAKYINRTVVPIAGHVPVWAVVNHRGRKSGREYRTPVAVLHKDGVYRVALPYGKDVDWVRNIVAAGEFTIVQQGKTIALTDPQIVHDPAVAWAPRVLRQVMKRMGAEYHLRAGIA